MTIVLWSVIGIVLLACAVLLFLRPRIEAGASPADIPAAKAAGDELLASHDTTALIVVAHPDDTEWWAGGTAAELARSNRVVLVMGTSGDRGAGGNVPGLGAVRERLQRQAGESIGYADILFLRNPDQGLAEATAFPGQVRAAYERYRPSIVLTFDVAHEAAGYHHVDHEAAGRAATAVAEERGGVTLYLFHTAAPDVIVDYSSVRERKRTAFAVLQDYRAANPTWGWLIGPLSTLMARGAGYGAKATFPGVGVEYGEVFRKVVIPAR